jgi:hypothetical protein
MRLVVILDGIIYCHSRAGGNPERISLQVVYRFFEQVESFTLALHILELKALDPRLRGDDRKKEYAEVARKSDDAVGGHFGWDHLLSFPLSCESRK